MSEPEGTTEQVGAMSSLEGDVDMAQQSHSGVTMLPEDSAAAGRGLKRPGYGNGNSGNAPAWLRPFFSLRTQLLFAYCMLSVLIVLIISFFLYQQVSRGFIVVVAIVAIGVGALLAYICTMLLLRPLWRVIDVAQAIAIGDLEQRERLFLRQPPQDEIDRLAGSLDEMVTRLERAEGAQRASEQRFKQFFADASHQLRTPLTSLRGFTEILIRGAIDEQETRQRVLLRMKSEGERMTRLLNDLLTLARLDDQHPLKLEYVDLVELGVEAIQQARLRCDEECTISLAVATQARLGIQADRERIKQLLFILLDNALKHGGPASEGEESMITLRLDRRDGQVVMKVIDNGEGIAKEDLAHIFESFYRGRRHAANKVRAAGAGLGLTIAHALVQMHNGTISVSSEPGKGTEFVILLPCVG